MQRGQKRKKIDKWEIGILIFFVSLLASTAYGGNFWENLPEFLQYSSALLLAIYVRRNWGTVVTLELLIKFALAAILIQSSVASLQHITHSSIGDVKSYFGDVQYTEYSKVYGYKVSRVRGTIGHPNIVANWIICLLPFLIFDIKYNYAIKGYNILKLCLLPMATITIILTYSRGCQIIFILFILFSIFFFYRTYIKSFIRQLLSWRILIFLILFLVSIFFIDYSTLKITLLYPLIVRFSTLNSIDTPSASLYGRVSLIREAFNSFTEHFFLGVGFNNSAKVLGIVSVFGTHFADILKPHNIYLLMALEGGIIAFFSYCFVSLYPVFRLIKLIPYKIPGAIPFLFSLLAIFMMQQIYLSAIMAIFAPLYMIILGAALGYAETQKNILDCQPKATNKL